MEASWKRGVPLNHPFLFGIFHYKPTSYLGYLSKAPISCNCFISTVIYEYVPYPIWYIYIWYVSIYIYDMYIYIYIWSPSFWIFSVWCGEVKRPTTPYPPMISSTFVQWVSNPQRVSQGTMGISNIAMEAMTHLEMINLFKVMIFHGYVR